MVFEVITPYLKSFHLALAKHFPQQNEEGWKLTNPEHIAYIEEKVLQGQYTWAQAETLLNTQEVNSDSASKQVTPTTIEEYYYF